MTLDAGRRNTTRIPAGSETLSGGNPLIRGSALAPAPAPRVALTARQTDVLVMLADGETYKNGAWRLGIARSTFHQHLKIAMAKLGAESAVQAVYLARRQIEEVLL